MTTLRILYSQSSYCVLISVFFCIGCAMPRKAPIYLARDFDSRSISTITVMPVVDGRLDRTLETDYSKILNTTVPRRLKERKYAVETVNETGSSVTKSEVAAAEPEWIASLGPRSARWIMVVVVDQVTRFTTAASESIAQVSGTLFDKRNRDVVWRGVGKGTMAGGLLLGGVTDNDSARMAARHLFFSLPKRGEESELYRGIGDPTIPAETPNDASIFIGMSQSDIKGLFSREPRIHDRSDGSTWIYHGNMGEIFIPGSAYFHKPKVWIFHFDSSGRLLEYQFTDQNSFR